MQKNIYWIAAVIILILVAVFIFTDRVNDATSPGMAELDSMNIIQVEMDVHGMVCNGCERLIEKKINEQDGILSVAASFRDSTVIVSYDSTKTKLDSLTHAVKAKGYKVAGVR
jgi:copper chaperone CopZ